MSSNNSLYFLGAAVVGIVSAVGVFIAEHFRQERRRHTMAQDRARLDQQLLGMQKEFGQLRQLQKEKLAQRGRKTKRHTTRTQSTAWDDYNSALDIDSSDLEFYDSSDEEDTVSTVTPINQALNELDDKVNSGNLTLIEEALNRLIDLCLESPENPELMWRIGKAHHKIACSSTNATMKEENITKGLMACRQAVKFNPNIAEAHKWLAILIGARCDGQPIKEKIGNAFLFKEHLDAALALSPTDPTLHHLLGRFAYEASCLTWLERKAAAAFFADPPTATYNEALEYAINAERLRKKDWKENKFLVARCQIGLGKYEEAVESLIKADAMSDDDCLDVTVDSEIKTLLQKYRKTG